MPSPIRLICIATDELDGVNPSVYYPSLSPSIFLSILKLSFLTSDSLILHCNPYDFKLCHLLCNILALNPFSSVSLRTTNTHAKFNFAASLFYLIFFFVYSVFVSLISIFILLFFTVLVACTSPPKFDSFLDYHSCVYWTSSLLRPSLRGGSIGHIKGVLSILDKYVFVSLFSTRNFLSELASHSRDSQYIHYPYPSFLFPDVDLYALSVSLHQLVVFLRKIFFSNIIHANSFFIYTRLSRGGFAAAIASVILRVPLVVEYNGSEVDISKLYKANTNYFSSISKLSENLLLNRASRIVTVSEVLSSELISRFPCKSIKWYPNCADINLLSYRSDYPSDYISLSYVSTFGRWHGAHLIPLAVNHIIENPHIFPLEHVSRFIFQIVGAGVSYDSFVDSIHNFKLDNYFHLHGLIPHEQALQIILDSQFSLLPTSQPSDASLFIGSPTKLFEYMSLGSIPIASDVGQQSSIISPACKFNASSSLLKPINPNLGSLGLVFDADSYHALAKAIYFACSNYSTISYIHSNCRDKISSSYTWQKNVSSLLT